MKQSLSIGSEQQVRQSQTTANNRSATSEMQSFVDNRPQTIAQRQLINAIHASPQMIAQRKQAVSIHNSPRMVAQREFSRSLQSPGVQLQAAPEEEMLQGKFETAQRVEEEEPLQGKFEAVQRVEEEEPLQGKFALAQQVEAEEPLQGKFDVAQRAQQSAAKPNNTGLPDNLKSGIEHLSGMSMDHVKVHYNSSQPAQLNALAYAQGADIHVATGQEQHLPHEAWHVVQQAQGRVKPTMQMRGSVPVNDDVGLEREADVMGGRAPSTGDREVKDQKERKMESSSLYRVIGETVNKGAVNQLYANKVVLDTARNHYDDGWGARYDITDDNALKAAVPNTVRGFGEISLGWFDAPETQQDPKDRRFQEECKIGYRNAREAEATAIYHCGPSGPKYWY